MTNKTNRSPGSALREAVLKDWELNPAEEAILGMACDTADEIAAMEAGLGANPDPSLLRAVRLHRSALSRLLKDLGLKAPKEPAPRQSGRRQSPKQAWGA